MRTFRQVPAIESRMEPHEYGVWILKHDAMDLVRLGNKLVRLLKETPTPKTEKAITQWEEKLKTL